MTIRTAINNLDARELKESLEQVHGESIIITDVSVMAVDGLLYVRFEGMESKCLYGANIFCFENKEIPFKYMVRDILCMKAFNEKELLEVINAK